jgi:hypothetical protein
VDDSSKHPIDERKVKFRSNAIGSKKDNTRWTIIITIVSFFLSATLQFASSATLEDVNNLVALAVVLIIIIIGIVFDIIGIAVTAADETPFHAMASRKYYGARQAISLIRNANKVSSFCNDVVGDICGVISGAASALIVFRVSQHSTAIDATLVSLALSGMVASLTVGGKAMGKTFAIQSSNYIVYKISVIIQFVVGRIKLTKTNKKGRSR